MVVAMSERALNRARWVSSIAATTISLACGTNYVYSAWGPQFAEKLKFSSTEQNLIGLSGNLGMYSLGIPIGMLVDTKGPRTPLFFGALLLGAGYFFLHSAYDRGEGSVAILCLFSYLTGLGGCLAFQASIKASALNWPHNRGSATGFPLAAFGLSAFFFSTVSQFVVHEDTGDFLMLLSYGTFGIVFVGFFFLRVLPHSHYSAVPTTPRGDASNRLHRTKSEESKYRAEQELLPETDIRGFSMLITVEFWQLFVLMGILSGVGLMTINNIGNDATALWRHYDDSVDENFIAKRQALHVSVISIFSFIGRILSGVGSDFLVKVLKASRLWCLTIASIIFLIAQFAALNIENPNHLVVVSSFTGIAYGFLFGCFPSLVAEAFGVHGLSTNWGFMTLSTVLSGNMFNLFYGMVYDNHSIIEPGGERECTEGLACYRSAYLVTVVACLVSLATSLWSKWYTHNLRIKEERELEESQREA